VGNTDDGMRGMFTDVRFGSCLEGENFLNRSGRRGRRFSPRRERQVLGGKWNLNDTRNTRQTRKKGLSCELFAVRVAVYSLPLQFHSLRVEVGELKFKDPSRKKLTKRLYKLTSVCSSA
jgi:hypothetical protein